MQYRKPIVHKSLEHFKVGPFEVKQPLPAKDLSQVSPFVLLHHGGPTYHAPGSIKARLSPHPHRGFEPVTFVFDGKLHLKDSTGSEGFLKPGDVQWMTSGSGIIHSEGPSQEFAREGGNMEIIQLWVNLPREFKMTPPKYQDIKKESIPVIREDGFEISLVAGDYKGHKGPASTFTPIMAMMVYFNRGAKTAIEIPSGFNAMVYLLDGSLESKGTTVDAYQLAVFDREGQGIELNATTGGKLLLLAGEPVNEPVVSYGPFVMNYPGEIKQAVMDYEMGKMGVLEG